MVIAISVAVNQKKGVYIYISVMKEYIIYIYEFSGMRDGMILAVAAESASSPAATGSRLVVGVRVGGCVGVCGG